MRSLLGIMAIVFLMTGLAWAQTETSTTETPVTPPPAAAPEAAAGTEAAPPAIQIAPEPTTPPAEVDSVAMTVNGKDFMESDIKNLFNQRMMSQTGGRSLPPDQMNRMLQTYRGHVMQELLDQHLIGQLCQGSEVTVTDEDVNRQLDNMVEFVLAQRNTTREEFSKMLQEKEGKTLDELLTETRNNPQFRQDVYLKKLVEKRQPGSTQVSEADVRDFYDKNLPTRYTSPERVRASHILIKTQGVTDAEAKAALRKKAEDILKEAKAENADFAALAAKYSECPSSKDGGDLNYFTRDRMVKPFADAAFAMQPGQISDIVESDFGYHIIKLTERQEAGVKTFDDVKKSIELELKSKKEQQQIDNILAEYRNKATITFPEGKQTTLPFQVQPQIPAATPPAEPQAGQDQPAADKENPDKTDKTE